jgi:hypothetical protein
VVRVAVGFSEIKKPFKCRGVYELAAAKANCYTTNALWVYNAAHGLPFPNQVSDVLN